MSLTNAAMIVAADALRTAATKLVVHSDDPGPLVADHAYSPTGDIVWSAATGPGNFDFSAPVDITGLPANAPVKWVSIWNTAVDACYGVWSVGSLTADGAGVFTVTDIDVTGWIS